MKYRLKISCIGIIGFLSLHTVFAGLIWIITSNYGVQFQETETWIKWLLFVPPAIASISWFVCLFVFLDNGIKKSKLSVHFANADGYKGPKTFRKQELKQHFTQFSLLMGSIFAIQFIFNLYNAQYDTLFVFDTIGPSKAGRASVEHSATPKLKLYSVELRNKLTSDKELTEITSHAYDNWISLLNAKLPSLTPESQKKVYFYQGLNEQDRNYAIQDDFFLAGDMYEYWIDPNDSTHFKIRYKYIFEDRLQNKEGVNHILKDPSNKLEKNYFERVYELRLDSKGNFAESTCNPVLPFRDSGLEYYVYDSQTRKMRFEYDKFLGNFFERNKFAFFVVWFLFGFFICCLIAKFMKKVQNLASSTKQEN